MKITRVAYVDSSAITAVAFQEPGSEAMAEELLRYKRLFSSNLLDAELRSACAREKVPYTPLHAARIRWVYPTRPLATEMERVLEAGYLRGADLWHVATALLVTRDPSEMAFVTLDERQRAVAAKLGFQV